MHLVANTDGLVRTNCRADYVSDEGQAISMRSMSIANCPPAPGW